MIETNQWPACHVEQMAVDKLIPYARNARSHSEAQVDQIAASIKEWGWTVPVLIDGGKTIIAGHGRVLAAQKLGLKKVPVMTAAGWSETQKRAYVIADNKLSDNAGWDAAMLKIEFEGLKELGFDTELVGFNGDPVTDHKSDKSTANPSDRFVEMVVQFGDRKIPVTQEERESFQALLDRYASEFGVHYGFAAWLCDAAGT